SQDIGMFDQDTYPMAINDSGVVVGWAYSSNFATARAWAWTADGGFRDLNQLLPPNASSYARGITAAGVIYGTAWMPTSGPGGFVLFPVPLPPPPPTVTVTAPSIVVATDVIGTAVPFVASGADSSGTPLTPLCTAEGVVVTPVSLLSVATHTIVC